MSPSCRCCGARTCAVEYAYDHPHHYDGVSEWACFRCKLRIGRWTGNILEWGCSEPPYGMGTYAKDTVEHRFACAFRHLHGLRMQPTPKRLLRMIGRDARSTSHGGPNLEGRLSKLRIRLLRTHGYEKDPTTGRWAAPWKT